MAGGASCKLEFGKRCDESIGQSVRKQETEASRGPRCIKRVQMWLVGEVIESAQQIFHPTVCACCKTGLQFRCDFCGSAEPDAER